MFLGSVKRVGGKWEITAEAHVRSRIKRIFKSVENKATVIKFSHTAAFAEDLEWIMSRYPLEISAQDRDFLANESKKSRDRVIEAESILLSDQTAILDLVVPLRAYQLQAVTLSKKLKRLLLADDIGLGKTASAIGLLADSGSLPAVVVCQSYLCAQWGEQIDKFAPGLTHHVVKSSKPYQVKASILIISYHKLHGWVSKLEGQIGTIVFDEAQELRHSTSTKYSCAKRLADAAKQALALTATPVFNYGSDIFNILDLLSDECLGTRDEFQNEWCTFKGTKWVVNDPKALGSHLRRQFLMLRRTRADVGRQLPPVQKMVEMVAYNPKIIDSLKADALQLSRIILGHQTASFVEKGIAARELDLKLRMATGIAKAPFVAELVSSLVESGTKVILFGWHREVYNIWCEKFRYNQTPHFLYTGSESADEKIKSFDSFRSLTSGGVLIMSLRAGSGLNGLQNCCNTVVFGELDWCPAQLDQCVGRVARDEQTESVLALYLISEAGSDPVMARLLGLKAIQSLGIVDMKDSPDPITEASDVRVAELAKAFILNYGK